MLLNTLKTIIGGFIFLSHFKTLNPENVNKNSLIMIVGFFIIVL